MNDGASCPSSDSTDDDEAVGALDTERDRRTRSVVDIVRQEWRLLLGLCCVSFCVNCQPSEPYLAKYLTEVKNITEADQEAYVWPYDTYGSFAFLLPLGMAAEIVGYRPVILLGLLCRQATRLILLYGTGLTMMSLMQVTYAAATGVNTIYYAYAFISCPRNVAPLAVTFINGSYHLGNVFGSLLAEWLVDHVALRTLFYISWGFSSAGLVLFLTVFPHPMKEFEARRPPSMYAVLLKDGPRAVGKELGRLYEPRVVRLWSMWWVLGFSANNTLDNYYQNLFYDIDPNGDFGYAEAEIEACLTVGALLPILSIHRTMRSSYPILIVGSCLIAASTMYATHGSSLTRAIIMTGTAEGLLALQQSSGEITISQTLHASSRYAFLYTSNSFVGLGVAVIIQKTLSHYSAVTNTYFYFVAMQMCAVCVLSIAYGVFTRCRPATSSTVGPLVQ